MLIIHDTLKQFQHCNKRSSNVDSTKPQHPTHYRNRVWIHIKCSTIRAILTQIFQRCMCRDVGLLAGNICRLAAAVLHSLQHRTSLWSNPKWKCACEPMLQSESGAGGCGIFTAWRCPGFPHPPVLSPWWWMCVCVQGGPTMELENKGVSSDILL